MTGPDDSPSPINADLLSRIGLFGGMSQETLATLAHELPRQHYEPGETVIREGEHAREMFVVLSGELEVVKTGKHAAGVRVAMFGPSDWFGEMAIVDVQPRSATVRAVAPTWVLRLGTDDVDRLLYRYNVRDYSLLLMNIARELSRRLRVADGILSQFVTAVSDEYVQKTKKATS